MAYTTNKRDLAFAISHMPFRDLIDVAKQIVDMNKDPDVMDRDPKTRLGMAETLSDWAEAAIEEEEERKTAVQGEDGQ